MGTAFHDLDLDDPLALPVGLSDGVVELRGEIRRRDIGVGERVEGKGAHRAPPLLRVIMRAAAREIAEHETTDRLAVDHVIGDRGEDAPTQILSSVRHGPNYSASRHM